MLVGYSRIEKGIVIGRDIVSAQEITVNDPSCLDNFDPTTYPTEAVRTAKKSIRSDRLKFVILFRLKLSNERTENIKIQKKPTNENSQNKNDSFCLK